jgi:multiple sugar transport system ATP-binding protein
MTMADKIVVLRGGRVEQIGAPLNLYNAPRNRFVAGFIGSPRMNFLPAKVTSVMQDAVDVTLKAGGSATLPFRAGAELIGHEVTLGIRPEHVQLRRSDGGELGLTATIELTERLGATSFLYCVLADGTKLTVQAAGQAEGASGQRIDVHIPASKAHLFDPTEAGIALERVPPPAGI